jgi:hypothetical protein
MNQSCSCQIQDVGIIPSVDHVFATIIFDKNCPIHGHIGRKNEQTEIKRIDNSRVE